MAKKPFYIIGIDEVGRGPLAGPVVVAGVKMELRIMNYELRRRKFFNNIKDSKKLTEKQREEWFGKITDYPKIEWAVAKVWPTVIDRINISEAANLAALRIYRKLIGRNTLWLSVTIGRPIVTDSHKANGRKRRQRQKAYNKFFAQLDGGLKLPFYIPHETIIRGDEKLSIISAASIIAKVTRDRLMIRLHKKYPKYRFDVHKGYPTKLHRKLIKKFGRSKIHRKSFSVS